MSIVFQEDGVVKATIPQELYLQIAGLQASEKLGWDEACKLAAERIDANNENYAKSVEKKALSLHRSELMSELNKGRNTIDAQGFERAKGQYEIWYYCSKCGKPITVSPNGNSHKAIIELMKQAGWSHSSCLGS